MNLKEIQNIYNNQLLEAKHVVEKTCDDLLKIICLFENWNTQMHQELNLIRVGDYNQ